MAFKFGISGVERPDSPVGIRR